MTSETTPLTAEKFRDAVNSLWLRLRDAEDYAARAVRERLVIEWLDALPDGQSFSVREHPSWAALFYAYVVGVTFLPHQVRDICESWPKAFPGVDLPPFLGASR